MHHDDFSQPIAVPITLVRKGRGAVSNIAHRFESVVRTPDSDSAELEHGEFDYEVLPALATSTTFETAKSLITYNDSPDIGFDRSINPYRGCEHGCIYCFAR
ncbi:MAG: PA0069 family radical SAM protein, partial [Burkholderiaceae bacterium]